MVKYPPSCQKPLKSLYKEYPKLIIKTADGQYKFKVSFFKRTKRLQYFLGIRLDGADTMQNIYKYFIDGNARDKKRYPNYFKYFSKTGRYPHKPVLLLFDNELESSRPLYKFLSEYKYTKEQRKELQSNLYLKLQEKGNVYVLTNPLVDGDKECEIECLFSKEVLGHRINEKVF